MPVERLAMGHVTVVVPTHNRAGLVMRTLRCVLAQRDVELDVVVVDDGSKDGTADALATFDDPRVRVVRNHSAAGVSAARNRGVAHATGEWVAFCDDDDVWAPTKLARQRRALERVEGAAWSSAGAVSVDDALRIVGGAEHPPPDGDVSAVLLARNLVPGGASSVMVRTALVRDVGGFDEQLSVAADFDLWTRLALAAPHAGVDAPLVGYRVSAGGMAHQIDRLVRDLRAVEAKYADARQAAGVTFAWRSYLRYIGAAQLRTGRRFPAAKTHATLLARYRDPEARSVLWRGTIAPRRVQAGRDRRVSERVPAEWRREADEWLREIALSAPRP